MHTGLVVMLINQDSCPILSFFCVEMECTDFYQHNKHFRSVNAYQLLLIFRINLISFIHFQFESERILLLIIKHNNRLKHGSVLKGLCVERIHRGKK